MAYTPRSVQTALQGILVAANTTTASNDLSGGLTTRIANDAIVLGTPKNAPRGLPQLPAVWVGLGDDDEGFASLGPSAQRDVKLRLHVVVGVNAPPVRGHDEAERLSDVMAANVKTIVRNSPQLGTSYIVHVLPTATRWNDVIPGVADNTYVAAATVTFQAVILST